MNRLQRNEILEIVESVIQPVGYTCLEVEWVASEKILRVYIDSENGVDMDDCLEVTRSLNEVESIDEKVPGLYRLEISSPGVDRPLRLAEHFNEVIGQDISVKLTEKSNGRKVGRGELLSVDSSGNVKMDIDGQLWEFSLEILNFAQGWHRSVKFRQENTIHSSRGCSEKQIIIFKQQTFALCK